MHERYFDNAATTPVDPRVVEAMLPWFSEFPGNASSLHQYGAKAMDAVEKARAQVARLIGAEDPSQITFTSGATEANNWVLHALKEKIGISPWEHSSIRETAERLDIPTIGEFQMLWPERFYYWDGELLAGPPRRRHQYAQMEINNETGTIFERISSLQGPSLVDATQAIGKLTFQVDEARYVTGSAHKFYGPKGVGFLYQQMPHQLEPFLKGGGQEQGQRAGTLNVPAIVGLGAAASIAEDQIPARYAHALKLNLLFQNELAVKDSRMNGGDKRSPFILSISFAGIEGETLLIELDRAGFCCSAGAACSSQNTEPSPVLRAFGVPDEYIRGTIRVSFSHHNTEESTYQLACEIRRIVTKLRELR